MKFVNKLYDYSSRIFSPYKRDIMYGRGALVREICSYHYPKRMNILFEHGVDAVHVDRFEQTCDAKAFLVYSEQKKSNLVHIGKSNVHVTRDPFTYVINPYFSNYDFYVDFSPAKNGKVLYFYGHSTPDIDDRKSTDIYINLIKKQIKMYGNCTVCLHFADVAKGIHRILERENIAWLSIPPLPRKLFPTRFYQMISQFEFFTSNVPGSYLYYISALNLPFKLLKELPDFVNISDTAQEDAFKGYFDEFPNNIAYDLFTNEFNELMPEKRQFSMQMLGTSKERTIADDVTLIKNLLLL